MWSSTQQNGQIAPGQSELLRSPFVQWQSDPTLSQTGDGQQRSKLLSSPGDTENDGLVWLKEDTAMLPFRTLGSLRFRTPWGRK